MLSELSKLFNRDIDRLKQELTLFKEEDKLWLVEGTVSNSAGNLALHLIGNLNHFIGAQLGDTGFIRNRSAEFNDKSISVSHLIKQLNETQSMITSVLGNLPTDELDHPFPIEIFGGIHTREFLIHLYGHLNYHLGQINYLRRLLET